MTDLQNEMVSISKSDLLILLETSLMLRNHMEYLDVPDCYNILEDGSLDSDTFDETGEYSNEEYAVMEDRVDNHLSVLTSVIRRNLN